MMKPSKLLKHFSMVWVRFKHSHISIFGCIVLRLKSAQADAVVSLVYIHLSVVRGHGQSGTIYLPPSTDLADRKRCNGSTSITLVRAHLEVICSKAYLQALLILLLLFIDYTKSEVNFVCLLKIGFHPHHLRKGFFGMFQRSVSVIEDTDPIPQFRFLL
jgi:hypothetical protein